MRFVVTARDGSPAGSQTEVLVDAEPSASLADLLPRLLATFDDGTHPSFAAGVQVWVNGVAIEHPEQHTIAAAGVRPGAIVELHSARERPAEPPSGVAEVRVVNGPGSGRIHRLTLGHTVIGSAAPGMALADDRLPANAFTVIAAAGGRVDVEPAAGVNATLDGEAISGRVPWPRGAYLVAGRTVLELAGVSPATASPASALTVPVVRSPAPPITPPGGWPPSHSDHPDHPDQRDRPDQSGHPDHSDPRDQADQPVSHPADASEPAQLADPPAAARETPQHRESRPGLRWLTGGRGPNHRQDRRPVHRPARPPEHGHRSDRSENLGAASGVASPVERARARRGAVPDPATLLLSALARDAGVWHRFPSDDDFLRLRIGLGERDGLPDVPIWADLASIGVLGIAGDPETTHALAAWLLAQCAALHSPRQVRLAALTTNQYAARRRWEWLIRVPHSDPGGVASADDDPEPPITALVGSDDETTDRRLAELSGLIADRRLMAATSSKATHLPRVVVLLDGARRLRGRPGLTELLTDGPEAGVYTICIDEDENWLPPGCREVITCTPREARLESGGEAVRPDGVEPAYSDQLSRLLAPLRDASPVPHDGPPAAATQDGLLSMLGLDDPRERRHLVETHWRGSPTGRIVIGAGHDGPFFVDLRLDGPHLLVAGEPAARPDALLAVVMASLAAANRPDHLNAILISTAPGPELAACAAMPHVTGVVEVHQEGTRTGRHDPDHDDAEGPPDATADPQAEEPVYRLQRALAGISAELDRRDALLSQAGARDVEDYAARGHRLARLLVIVDDVVELAEHLPDGLSELVSAAQRGESLGLTLLMGTARPHDIAAHEIASVLSANATLRICLRVATETASRAVIDAAEAARIPRRAQGRGYARTGHWPLLGFQAPRLGALPPPPVSGARAADPDEPLAWALPWDDAGHPAPLRPSGTSTAAGGSAVPALAAELAALATAAQEAASALMVTPPEPPWLPPLPRIVPAATLRTRLPPPSSSLIDLTDPVGLPHPWALEERPESQGRAAAAIELGRSGHLLLSGASGSGRTTALRTIAGVLADRVSSADLHIYALDCGDSALSCLDELPHLGALVRRSERARAGRVLSQLVEEVAARRETLAEHHWADAEEQRAVASSDDRLPYLMLMIDRWEGLATGPDGDTLTEQVLLLLRRGALAGLHVVVTGDRSLLKSRASTLVVPTVLLRPDVVDYSLAGLKPPVNSRRQPSLVPPGRGVWADSGVQLQISVLSADTSARGQIAAIEDIARRRARRNDSVPESLRPVRL